MNPIVENLFMPSQIHRTILLQMREVGDTLKSNLENKIRILFEGKCCNEGIIQSGSSKLIGYDSGKINRDGLIEISCIIECKICNPVTNMVIPCKINAITKAGIRADSATEDPSPIVVFVSREYTSTLNNLNDFSKYNIGDQILVNVIGQKYQLNDPVISVIGELYVEKQRGYKNKK